MSQVWSRVVSVLIQGGLWGWEALQKFSSETHNSKEKVIWKSFELDTNASQACWACKWAQNGLQTASQMYQITPKFAPKVSPRLCIFMVSPTVHNFGGVRPFWVRKRSEISPRLASIASLFCSKWTQICPKWLFDSPQHCIQAQPAEQISSLYSSKCYHSIAQ